MKTIYNAGRKIYVPRIEKDPHKDEIKSSK